MDLSKILEMLAVIASYLCGKIKINPEGVTEKVAKGMTVISTLYLMIGCIDSTDRFIYAILYFSQECWIWICIYIVIAAFFPSYVAKRERMKKLFKADEKYERANRGFNLLGAVATCMMLTIMHMVIEDFSYLQEFQIEGVVAIFIPACMSLTLAYQSIEQKNKELDHDASVMWLNQKLNMLYLFSTYFFSIISTVYIVAYTMYCHIHGKQLEMNLWYYGFLTLMLIFFYVLSQHRYVYLYLIFVIYVPVFLIASVYWMSWFSMNDIMRWFQCIFLAGHSIIYAICIFVRKERISAKKMREMGYNEDNEKNTESEKIIQKHSFQIILLLLIALSYIVVWVVPILKERIKKDEAQNYIVKICENTNVSAYDILKKMEGQITYDKDNDNYDKIEYLKFVDEELRPQIERKKIVQTEKERLTYDKLVNWYVKTP